MGFRAGAFRDRSQMSRDVMKVIIDIIDNMMQNPKP